MTQYSEARLDTMRRRFPNLAPELLAAHRFVASDTHIALAKLRLILERVAKASFTHFVQRPIPEDASLGSLLRDEDFKSALPLHVVNALHSVRMVANRAIHDERVSEPETIDAMSRMLDILEWSSTWWDGSSSSPRPSSTYGWQKYQEYTPSPSPAPAALPTGLMVVGIGVLVGVVALVWLYIRVLLPGFMGEQQRNWVQRKHQESSVGGAVILSHPTPRAAAYVRGYPSSWPAPFFEEEIRPGAWGRWVEEPASRIDGSSQEQDFIWYWSGEAGGIREAAEWSIQCESREGIVRDVAAGHNEDCEGARRLRIRNDWSRPAFVYYFKKHR